MFAMLLAASKPFFAGLISLLLAMGGGNAPAPEPAPAEPPPATVVEPETQPIVDEGTAAPPADDAAEAPAAPTAPEVIAEADEAAAPAAPERVTADALPTVQINGVAWSQAIVGTTVYVAGKFTSARPAGAAPGTQEVPRSNLLAYDIRTGELISSWAPNLNAQAMVVTASPDGSRIYVGGDFSTVDGQPRSRVAAFSTATGQLVPDFRVSMFGQVRAIAATDSTVYIGGSFTAVGSAARNGLAALSAADGSLLSWAPQPGVGSTSGNRLPNRPDLNASTSDDVMALVLTGGGSQVVAAGRFDTLNGVRSTGVGALDPVTGETRPFAIGKLLTNQGVNSAVFSLSTDGTRVFGTAYDYYGPGNLEGSFAVTAQGGEIISINDCRGDTYASYPMGGTLHLAGHPHDCSQIGGFPEQSPRVSKYATAVSIDPVGTVGSRTMANANFSGKPAAELLNWFPAMSPGTYTGQGQAGWSVTGNDQYVVYGGEFPRVNGAVQQGLVRYAVPAIAPNEMGPAPTDDLTPTATAVAPGLVRLTWRATSDQDDADLTYRVYRDGDTTTAVGSVTGTSSWWNRPTLTFTDSGLDGGTHRYLVTASDAAGNTVGSSWTSVEVAAGGSGPRAYADVVRADGAQGYWPLGEPGRGTAYDHAGRTDLAVASGVTVGRTGAITGDRDTAYAFNGKSSGIAYAPSATPAPDTFTVEAWFRTTTKTGGKIVGFGNSRSSQSSTYDRHVYMDGQGRVFFGVDSSLKRTISSGTGFNDGDWHYVAASLSPAGMTLYVDGTLVGSRADTTTGTSYNGYLRIGGDRSWAGDAWFDGQIDDVALYPTALPADRIANHHSLGSTGEALNLRPEARFTSASEYLAASFDASGSADPDGTVAGYAWDFGDGTTGTGGAPSHRYDEPGTYTVTLTVTDEEGASASVAGTVTVVAPPPNEVPTAVLAVTADGLDVTVDAAGSVDPDGEVVSYAWTFGDGATAAGPTAAHTYGADGTYTVVLTVTDDDGDSSTAEQEITVKAPVILAADTFDRVVTGGWGMADVGGIWTAVSAAIRQAVGDGAATFSLAPGTQSSAHLTELAATDVDMETVLSLDQALTGSGVNVLLTGRRVAANQEYRVRLRMRADGTVLAALTKVDGAGDVLLTPEMTLPDRYATGTPLRVRLVVAGTGTTRLSARFSDATAPEPTDSWTLTATDSTAALQAPGGVGVMAYLTSNATTNLTVRLSELEVRKAD